MKKPISVEPSLEFGKELSVELYDSVLDVISGGYDAFDLAERTRHEIDKQDWQELDRICQALRQWVENQHAFACALKKMMLFVYLQDPRNDET